MYTKNQSIRELVDKNRILIAAHRGTCGGNVVQNTCLAYKNALLHGYDRGGCVNDYGQSILRIP